MPLPIPCPCYNIRLTITGSTSEYAVHWDDRTLAQRDDIDEIREKTPCKGFLRIDVQEGADGGVHINWQCSANPNIMPYSRVQMLPFELDELREWIDEKIQTRYGEPPPPKVVMSLWEQIKLD